nr:hypothetical protein [uncultured Sphaerochaeta sp.]
MQLLEQFLRSKRGVPELCEDALFFNDHFAAVVDGCTSRKPIKGVPKSSGVIAKECILQGLESLQGNESMTQVFQVLNDSITTWYRGIGRECEFEADKESRCSAYAAIVSVAHRQVWVLGDCQALINDTLVTSHKAIDTLMEGVRALLVEYELANGVTVEELLLNPQPVQQKLASLMKLQTVFQNSDPSLSYSYSVLDGFFTDMESVQVLDLPHDTVEVVLASDGYPQVFPTLEATEQYLQKQLEEDPLMVFKNRATKPLFPGNCSFDDRSFLRVLV